MKIEIVEGQDTKKIAPHNLKVSVTRTKEVAEELSLSQIDDRIKGEEGAIKNYENEIIKHQALIEEYKALKEEIEKAL